MKANVGNVSVDGVKSVSFNIRDNIAQAIKLTTVEPKLNTTLQVVSLAVATFLLCDVINISTQFGSTPTHVSNPFLNSISMVEAKGLLYQVKSFSFIISLVSFDRVFSCTKQLSDQLQFSTIDFFCASELVSATKAMPLEFCSDGYWDVVYRYSTDIAQLHSISIETESNTRRRKRPLHWEDCVITSPTGFRES